VRDGAYCIAASSDRAAQHTDKVSRPHAACTGAATDFRLYRHNSVAQACPSDNFVASLSLPLKSLRERAMT